MKEDRSLTQGEDIDLRKLLRFIELYPTHTNKELESKLGLSAHQRLIIAPRLMKAGYIKVRRNPPTFIEKVETLIKELKEKE